MHRLAVSVMLGLGPGTRDKDLGDTSREMQ